MDAENKKLYLTRKKAMVESTLPLFLSFADARPGRVSHGYIVCVKDFGCIVRFYNGVKGLVPVSELSHEPVLSPEEVFYVGQVRSSNHVEAEICFMLVVAATCPGSVLDDSDSQHAALLCVQLVPAAHRNTSDWCVARKSSYVFLCFFGF